MAKTSQRATCHSADVRTSEAARLEMALQGLASALFEIARNRVRHPGTAPASAPSRVEGDSGTGPVPANRAVRPRVACQPYQRPQLAGVGL